MVATERRACVAHDVLVDVDSTPGAVLARARREVRPPGE